MINKPSYLGLGPWHRSSAFEKRSSWLRSGSQISRTLITDRNVKTQVGIDEAPLYLP